MGIFERFQRKKPGPQQTIPTPPIQKSWYIPDSEYYTLYENMLSQPHLLIAGATGSGKSVVINALIYTALQLYAPISARGGAQFILIDPKRVELVQYKNLPHTICYASEPVEMIHALHCAMSICNNRYKQMQASENRKFPGGNVYVIIDEFADLMTTNKKQVQPIIQRLAQIGRAANVHIILATQTPITKVLPTEIKCNFDARIGLRTRSAQDSRNIIGVSRLETLPRYGQCYYMTPDEFKKYNLPMIDECEIDQIIKYWIAQK